jgi:hypothetical protein
MGKIRHFKFKEMRRLLITLVFAAGFFATALAQDYRTAIGVRAGYPAGITLKHFMSSRTAFEGLFTTRYGGLAITGLLEAHQQAFDVENLNWYYGFGAHVGFYDDNRNRSWGDSGVDYTVFGIDGILGIEYRFTEIPFNIGIDWKPAFNIIGYTDFYGDAFALSLRFIF